MLLVIIIGNSRTPGKGQRGGDTIEMLWLNVAFNGCCCCLVWRLATSMVSQSLTGCRKCAFSTSAHLISTVCTSIACRIPALLKFFWSFSLNESVVTPSIQNLWSANVRLLQSDFYSPVHYSRLSFFYWKTWISLGTVQASLTFVAKSGESKNLGKRRGKIVGNCCFGKMCFTSIFSVIIHVLPACGDLQLQVQFVWRSCVYFLYFFM